jgi:hypothetical protein
MVIKMIKKTHLQGRETHSTTCFFAPFLNLVARIILEKKNKYANFIPNLNSSRKKTKEIFFIFTKKTD